MNVNKFKKVFFEFNTIEPPIDVEGNNVEFICDNEGNAIGFRKKTSNLNEYSYDLRIFEERYNIMIIQGGRVGLLTPDNLEYILNIYLIYINMLAAASTQAGPPEFVLSSSPAEPADYSNVYKVYIVLHGQGIRASDSSGYWLC